MIIGNNNSFNKTPNLNNIGKNINMNNNTQQKPGLIHEEAKYKDASNSNDMLDKSMVMLQDRLQNGLISYEEFTKQCEKLNKLRRK